MTSNPASSFTRAQTHRPRSVVWVMIGIVALLASACSERADRPANVATPRTATSALGSGLFDDSGQRFGNALHYDFATGDVDGDGDLDLVTATNYNLPNTVWLNDGSGQFTDSGKTLDTVGAFDVELADLDGDGDNDAILAGLGGGTAPSVRMNDGTGTFTVTQLFPEVFISGIAVGDVDGDGDLDLALVSRSSHQSAIWLNDGAGAFTVGSALGASDSFDVRLADLDGDNDLDAIVANYTNKPNRVFFNDGAGNFTDSGQLLGAASTTNIDVADVDGDGDLDAFAANDGAVDQLWINDGAGVFSAVPVGALAERSHGIALADLDDDGDADALVAVIGGPNRLWINDGAGNFTADAQIFGNQDTRATDLVDIDNDGDLDAIFADAVTNQVWFNNGRPTGQPDLYSVNRTAVLNVAAPGVIANDDEPEGTPLTATLVQDVATGNLTFNADGGFNYDPPNSFTGDVTFTYTISDGVSVSAPITVTIQVTTTNVAPSFTSTPVTVGTEGALYTYDVVATDPDAGDTLTLTASTLPAWLTLTDHGDGTATLEGTPAQANVGVNAVVLVVADAAGELSTQAFTIDVADVAHDPTFTSTPITVGTQGVLYTYTLAATDLDGDALAFSIDFLPAWLTLTDHGDGTATLEGSPAAADLGPNAIVAVVEDGNGGAALQSFTITVADVNEAPSFTSTPVTVGTEGALYTYDVVATDPDAGDTLTLTASTLPAWLTLTDHGDGTATLEGTPAQANVGINAVALVVTDAAGVSVTQSFSIDVADVAHDPTFTSTPITVGTQGVLYTYAIAATDLDGDPLAFSADFLPTWLTLTDHGDGTATLEGTPTNSEVGDHPIFLVVDDGNGTGAFQSFTITVINANDAPAFTSTPVATVDENALYSYTVTATDSDAGDSLTITATVLPAWLTLTDHGDGTATLEGTPTAADLGSQPVSLLVVDLAGTSDVQAFSIIVNDVNENPAFTSTPVTSVTEGALYSTLITATDGDGDPIAISIDLLPAWLTLTDHGDGTATLEGTPTAADLGSTPIVVIADDGRGGAASQMFVIDVNPANQAPSFTTDPFIGALQNEALSTTVVTEDADGDAVTITSALPLPAWLTLTDNGDGTATLTGTPGQPQVGTLTFDLIADDGRGGVTTTTHTLEVLDVNDDPTFTSIPGTLAVANLPYTYTVRTNDLDGDAVAFGTDFLPAWLTFTDNGNGTATLAGEPSNANIGSYEITIALDDGNGGSAIQTWTLRVQSDGTNIPPVFTSSPVLVATENVVYSYLVTGNDPDGGTIAFTGENLPAWLTLTDVGDGTATLVGTPAQAQVGPHAIVLVATDDDNPVATSRQSFTLTVANVNDNPTFTSTPITSVVAGRPYRYTVTTEDLDGDLVALGADFLPAWLTLTDNGDGTATLEGTPTSTEVGEHAIVIAADDSHGGSRLQSFTIIVRGSNAAPVFVDPTPANAAALTATEATELTFTLTASDDDGDTLAYNAFPLPTGATVDGATGVFAWTPTWQDAGTYRLALAVSDGTDTDERTITITVAFLDGDQDTLPDTWEVSVGLDPTRIDSDGDFISDAREVGDLDAPLNSDDDTTLDALDDDSDNDGISDADEAGDEDYATAPINSDTDALPDYRDDDSDNDGTFDAADNCRLLPNDQADNDNDGLGDPCDDDDDNDGLTDLVELRNDLDPLNADSDDDTIADAEEFGDGPDPLNTDADRFIDALDPDSDNDGIADAEEAGDTDLGTPPINTDAADEPDFRDTDSDNDGALDRTDNCRLVANDDQLDTDSDGDGDACDDDADADTIANDEDNCPFIANTDQADADADADGDVCDSDDDGDGVNDDVDNCPGLSAPDQTDTDGDGLGDACDPDADGDFTDDDQDNCPGLSNYDQSDIDRDNVGDACDDNIDGDDLPNASDNCPAVANNGQDDNDADGTGDFCDDDDDNDGVTDGTDNCHFVANADQADSDGDGIGNVCEVADGLKVGGGQAFNCAVTPGSHSGNTGVLMIFGLLLGLLFWRRRSDRTKGE